MPMPFFVDSNGVPLVIDKPKPQLEAVEIFVEEPLHVIAARQHAKDSTKRDTNKES
jgi:hypothetical protein